MNSWKTKEFQLHNSTYIEPRNLQIERYHHISWDIRKCLIGIKTIFFSANPGRLFLKGDTIIWENHEIWFL